MRPPTGLTSNIFTDRSKTIGQTAKAMPRHSRHLDPIVLQRGGVRKRKHNTVKTANKKSRHPPMKLSTRVLAATLLPALRFLKQERKRVRRQLVAAARNVSTGPQTKLPVNGLYQTSEWTIVYGPGPPAHTGEDLTPRYEPDPLETTSDPTMLSCIAMAENALNDSVRIFPHERQSLHS